jgi:hypothetical protein
MRKATVTGSLVRPFAREVTRSRYCPLRSALPRIRPVNVNVLNPATSVRVKLPTDTYRGHELPRRPLRATQRPLRRIPLERRWMVNVVVAAVALR